jgi:hypothetical protein
MGKWIFSLTSMVTPHLDGFEPQGESPFMKKVKASKILGEAGRA